MDYNESEEKNMKKLLTIVIFIIGVLDLALLTGLFISLGWTFAFTILGYSLPTAAALLVALPSPQAIYRLASKLLQFADVLASVPVAQQQVGVIRESTREP